MKPLVSLDIFDTAIFRGVFKPTDIFCIVEEKVKSNFYTKRIEAQDKARRKSIYYNIFDIYSYIPSFDLKEEIKTEYANCKANPYILDIYNRGEADYIFISDMYLPEKVLAGMLERCGYENPKVFVSCDYKACKGDGRLFRVVEEKLGRKIDKHIGDNYACDIEGSKKAAIKEQEFIGPAIYNREVVTPELENKRLRKLLIDEELSDHDIAEKIGYLFAPLTLAFTKSVLDEATDDQTIFFNARDGFIMYIVARWILKTKKKIKYCRFSRKSCYISAINKDKAITDDDNKFIFGFLKGQRSVTVRDFLRVFKLNEDRDYKQVLGSYGINLDTNIEFCPKRSTILADVIKFAQDEVVEVSLREQSNFLKYVKNLGMKNWDYFLDLGYRGSMQAMIKRITGIDLKGNYACTFSNSQEYENIKIEKASFLDVGFFGFYGGVVELVFSEPQGTVCSYSAEGRPIVSVDTKFRKDVTKGILRGIVKGVRDMVAGDVNVTKQDCQKIIQRFLNSPTIEEANFANSEVFENGSFVKNESIVNFNKELIREGKIKECYSKSYWKDAFKLLLSNSEDYKCLENFIK